MCRKVLFGKFQEKRGLGTESMMEEEDSSGKVRILSGRGSLESCQRMSEGHVYPESWRQDSQSNRPGAAGARARAGRQVPAGIRL